MLNPTVSFPPGEVLKQAEIDKKKKTANTVLTGYVSFRGWLVGKESGTFLEDFRSKVVVEMGA